jgi:hypothetical protein
MNFSPQWIHGLTKKIFPSLRKTQSWNLSLTVFGQIKSQSGILSKIVRQIPGAVKHKHRLKRLWRFVSNHRVKPERLQAHWVSWCIRTFTPPCQKHIVVALDWTTLPGNIQCLMAAIPFKGRAIPLLWTIYLFSDIKDSQNKIEERLIARLNNLFILSGKRLVLVADRGFGRATLISYLQRKQILFVVRVKSKVWITIGKKTKILLSKLYLVPEKRYWYKRITFREDGIVQRVSMAMVVAKGSDDPWFLLTNLKRADIAIANYQLRFDIEEWFKDLKHELGITDLQTKNLKRVRRIVLISALSYSILALVGWVAERKRKVMDQVITGGRKVASIIWFAGRIIEHNLLKSQFWKKVKVLGVAP